MATRTDEPTDAEIASWNEMAEELLDRMEERCAATGMDDAGVAISLWISLIAFLAEVGWTAPELAALVAERAQPPERGAVQ